MFKSTAVYSLTVIYYIHKPCYLHVILRYLKSTVIISWYCCKIFNLSFCKKYCGSTRFARFI